MYKVYANGQLLSPLFLSDQIHRVFDPTITFEPNTINSFTFEIQSDHPILSQIRHRTTYITVEDDTEEIFRGRIVEIESDLYNTGDIYVEHELAFLKDSTHRPFGFSGGVEEFFTDLIENHNSQVDEARQFRVGVVTVTDPNDYIVRSSQAATDTWTLIQEKLIGLLGGYIRTRLENGVRYIDYIAEYGMLTGQQVRFGENLLDIARKQNTAAVVTCLIPYGAEFEEESEDYEEEPENGAWNGNRLTIASVNDGMDYIENAAGIAIYGRVWGTNVWDDVTLPENLLSKGTEWLEAQVGAAISIEASVLDLHLVDADIPRLKYGYLVPVYSEPHDISTTLQISKQVLHLDAPGKDVVTLGMSYSALTDVSGGGGGTGSGNVVVVSGAASDPAVDEKISELELLIAERALITDLDAVTADVQYIAANKANITDLNATNATVNDLRANKANVSDLNATNATITTLDADVANIESLLAGNVGAGTLQAIHLTSDNVVIADATIVDAMIKSLTASKVTAGTIYTSFVKIADSSNENMLIDGSTIQIKDTSGTVRVQIGKDGSGEYSMYLWDANGTLLWRPTGITGDGIGRGTIKNVNVAGDAAIDGSKLDITSVAEKLNEDGSITVDSSNVKIDNTTLSAAYSSLKTTVTNQGTSISNLQTSVSTINGKITSKVWQSDIDTAVDDLTNGEIKTLSDKYSTLNQTVSGIGTRVGSLETTVNGSGSTTGLVSRMSTVEQTTTSLTSRVSTTETKVTTAQSTADTAKTNAATAQSTANTAKTNAATAQSTADAAKTAAANAQSTADTAASNVSTLTTNFNSYKTQTDNKIATNVTAISNLDGRVDTAEASLVLKVDKDSLISEINASADVIVLNSNRLVIDSNNLSLTKDGKLTTSKIYTENLALQGASGTLSMQAPSNSAYAAVNSSGDLYFLCDGAMTLTTTGEANGLSGRTGIWINDDVTFYKAPTIPGLPVGLKIQYGTVSCPFVADNTKSTSVTFETAFTSKPVVFVSQVFNTANCVVLPDSTTTTGFTITIAPVGSSGTRKVAWVAIGV